MSSLYQFVFKWALPVIGIEEQQKRLVLVWETRLSQMGYSSLGSDAVACENNWTLLAVHALSSGTLLE